MTQNGPVPLPKWIERLEAHHEMLDCASTIEEWNEVLSEIFIFWIIQDRPDLLVNRQRTILTEAVRLGFTPKPHRASRKLIARSDAHLILRTGCATFIEAARRIAAARDLPLDRARKRVLRAEDELGFRLLRSRPFGRKP
jgi:hypothetical protein